MALSRRKRKKPAYPITEKIVGGKLIKASTAPSAVGRVPPTRVKLPDGFRVTLKFHQEVELSVHQLVALHTALQRVFTTDRGRLDYLPFLDPLHSMVTGMVLKLADGNVLIDGFEVVP